MNDTIKLGNIKIPVTDFASQGNAVLGIRDSGKSYSATYLAERLLDAGIPFVAFDPIGIWKYLRVAGKGKGYPVVVASVESGDLPLTVHSAPEIVRAAMQQGVSLVIDLYDMSMSKSDWKTIVEQCIRILLYENKKYGLRHVFIEEAAEFVPQRIGPDQGRVYAEIEKLARMGGNALLGYTLINQRAEEINKAVLELCDRLFLHRQKGKNSLISLGKWMDVGSQSETKPIVQSLPMLEQGECWLWDAGSSTPERVKMPEKRTYHPDRRVLKSPASDKTAGATDVAAFVERMMGSLEKHVAQAKENDPKELRRRITELEKQLKQTKIITETVNIPMITEEEKEEARLLISQFRELIDAYQQEAHAIFEQAERMQVSIRNIVTKMNVATTKQGPITRAPYGINPPKLESKNARTGAGATSSKLTNPQQRIVDAIAWLESLRLYTPKRTVVAFLAGQSSKSSTFKNNLSALRSLGLIDYAGGDALSFTDLGRSSAGEFDTPQNSEDVQREIMSRLPRPQANILNILVTYYPGVVLRDNCAEMVGQSPRSSTFKNNLSALRSLGVIDYAGADGVKAMPVLFME